MVTFAKSLFKPEISSLSDWDITTEKTEGRQKEDRSKREDH